MAAPSIDIISDHAGLRLAQRNLSRHDVEYVLAHGRRIWAGSALFVVLRGRDIPHDDLRVDRRRRLEGTVLVLDTTTGRHLTTVYRNRRTAVRDIKRKRKRSLSIYDGD